MCKPSIEPSVPDTTNSYRPAFQILGHPDDDITVYNRFFPQNLDEQSEIGDIYYSLIDTLPQETKPITATFIIDNNDFDSACLESGDDTRMKMLARKEVIGMSMPRMAWKSSIFAMWHIASRISRPTMTVAL
jgi:hypothetical protein